MGLQTKIFLIFFGLQTQVFNYSFGLQTQFLFEAGGPNKGFEQIQDIPDSYLAIDNLAIGHGARIPLGLFGFLY